jgi:hypothetical protein
LVISGNTFNLKHFNACYSGRLILYDLRNILHTKAGIGRGYFPLRLKMVIRPKEKIHLNISTENPVFSRSVAESAAHP